MIGASDKIFGYLDRELKTDSKYPRDLPSDFFLSMRSMNSLELLFILGSTTMKGKRPKGLKKIENRQ